MVQYTFILVVLECSILVHSTMGSSSSSGLLRRRNKMPTFQEEHVYANNQTTSIAAFGQSNHNHNNITLREMQQQDNNNNNNNNKNVFTFPYNPNAVDCQNGRKAQNLQRKYNIKIAQWKANKPSCYTYTLVRVCYQCPLTPVKVSVNGGVVVKTEPPQDSADETPPTMDELFAMLSSCIYDCQEQYIHQCRVRFAGKRSGVIEGLYTDEYQDLIDDEYEIYVRNFKEC